MMRLMLAFLVFAFGLVGAFGQQSTFNVLESLAVLKRFQRETMAEATKLGSEAAQTSARIRITEKATLLLKDVKLDSVSPADCMALAQIQVVANQLPAALRTFDRFCTVAEPREKNAAMTMAMQYAYLTNDYERLNRYALEVPFPTPSEAVSFVARWVRYGLPTVQAYAGNDVAFTTLESLQTRSLATPLMRAVQVSDIRVLCAMARAEIHEAGGQITEGLQTLAVAETAIGTSNPSALAELKLVQSRLRAVGKPMLPVKIDFVSASSKNVEQALSSLRGKVTLFSFFAHWDSDSTMAIGEFAALANEDDFKELQVVGLTQPYGFFGESKGLAPDGELSKIVESNKNHRVEILWMMGPPANFSAVGARRLPQAMLVDKKGTVRKIWVGFDPSQIDEMKKITKELLAEK